MIGITEVAATASVLAQGRKLLRELAQGNLAEQHQALVSQTMEVVTDAQERLAVLQAGLIELQEANRALRDELRALEDWNGRLAQYELVQTPGGGLAYRSIASQVEHYACPSCIETKKQLQILQPPRTKYSGSYTCSGCDKKYQLRIGAPAPTSYARR